MGLIVWIAISGRTLNRRTVGVCIIPLEYGWPFSTQKWRIIDKEIVPDRFFTVLNLIYAPSLQRLSSIGWVHDDTFIIIAGGSYAISPRLLFGAEVRHENLAHNGFLIAHALFVGPHLSMRPVENLSVKIAWAMQIPDVAAHRADLVNFERSQVLLQLVTHF